MQINMQNEIISLWKKKHNCDLWKVKKKSTHKLELLNWSISVCDASAKNDRVKKTLSSIHIDVKRSLFSFISIQLRSIYTYNFFLFYYDWSIVMHHTLFIHYNNRYRRTDSTVYSTCCYCVFCFFIYTK